MFALIAGPAYVPQKLDHWSLDVKLTAKQEKFAQLLFRGHTQYDAYMQTYSPSDNRNLVDVNASRIANSTKIKLRVEELNAPVLDSLVSDKIERRQNLTKLERLPLDSESISASNKIQAIGLHSKLAGDFEEPAFQDNRQFIYITSEKAKEMLGRVADRRKALPEGVTAIEGVDNE